MGPENAIAGGEQERLREDQTDPQNIEDLLAGIVANQDNVQATAEILGPRHVRIILRKVEIEEFPMLRNNRVVVRDLRTDGF